MQPVSRPNQIAFGVHFFRVLTFCAALFFCHRLTSFGIMAREFPGLGGTHALQSFLVGTASDFWTATLLALFASGILSLASALAPLHLFAGKITGLALGALAALIVAHQGYVEFYRAPIMAFHLRYLADPEFLGASATTAWSPLVAANIAGAVFAWWISSRATARMTTHARAWPANRIAVATLVLAIAVHALQIRYRVQWFVPGPLQFNALEKIAFDLGKQDLVPPPSDAERDRFRELQTSLARHPAQESKEAQARLRFRAQLRDAFQKRIKDGKRPVIAVMALETFRPSEVGAYRTGGPAASTGDPGLTPEFDRLAPGGILFREAWSSGTITCAAQEALWCGQASGMLTSLMRVRTQVPASCVPDEVPAAGGFSLWIHNGQSRFDNQVSFWTRHGVGRAISAQDFPEGTPGGSWGLSDLALARRAATEIAEARGDARHQFIVPFALTVTNHIPWDLPSDAPPRIAALTAPAGQNQKMWRTTAYTDAAIGQFVAAARELGFWDDLILILASDHGNLEPGRHATMSDPGQEQDGPARRQSHIALLITGGLTGSIPREFKEVHDAVGQTGVAQLIRWIVARDPPSLASPDILSWPREWPVFSDQNDNILVAGDGAGEEAVVTPQVKLMTRASLKKDLTRDLPRNDAGIVFKVMTDPAGFKPLLHAPLANNPGSRIAD